MTVLELIKLLEKENHEHLVILSNDPEGNKYSPIHDVVKGEYVKEDQTVLLTEFGDISVEGAEKVIILYPIN